MLTGVTVPVGAILAPSGQRATYVAEDLTGLLAPYPDISQTGGVAAVGGWTAKLDGGRLTLDGSGERVDALRALCAAAWQGDAPVAPEVARKLVQQAGYPL